MINPACFHKDFEIIIEILLKSGYRYPELSELMHLPIGGETVLVHSKTGSLAFISQATAQVRYENV